MSVPIGTAAAEEAVAIARGEQAANRVYINGVFYVPEEKYAALTARVEELEGALSGVLWMAEEWFKHGGDETTFADDYEAKLEAARAAITKGEREG